MYHGPSVKFKNMRLLELNKRKYNCDVEWANRFQDTNPMRDKLKISKLKK
jgi:hypothetical protein